MAEGPAMYCDEKAVRLRASGTDSLIGKPEWQSILVDTVASTAESSMAKLGLACAGSGTQRLLLSSPCEATASKAHWGRLSLGTALLPLRARRQVGLNCEVMRHTSDERTQQNMHTWLRYS